MMIEMVVVIAVQGAVRELFHLVLLLKRVRQNGAALRVVTNDRGQTGTGGRQHGGVTADGLRGEQWTLADVAQVA